MWGVINPFSLKVHSFASFPPVLDLLSAGMCHHTPEGAERREVADELRSLLHLLSCSWHRLALILGSQGFRRQQPEEAEGHARTIPSRSKQTSS